MLYFEHHKKIRTFLYSLEPKNYKKLCVHGNWGRTETGDTAVPLAWYATMDMSASGWVIIAYCSNCLISPGWLASIAVGDSVLIATLLCIYINVYQGYLLTIQE